MMTSLRLYRMRPSITDTEGLPDFHFREHAQNLDVCITFFPLIRETKRNQLTDIIFIVIMSVSR